MLRGKGHRGDVTDCCLHGLRAVQAGLKGEEPEWITKKHIDGLKEMNVRECAVCLKANHA